ncbi:MAG: hypothetical protein IKL44_05965 [Clostridia bacterium]|nr:hypothetical protein [Clostridia bacterium]
MKHRYEAPDFELLRMLAANDVCFGDSSFDVDGEFGDYETQPDEGGDDL